MTKTWLIFTQALKHAFTQLTTLLLIGGLIILPSTYAWLAIKANQNEPFQQIKIALINLDEGTNLYEKPINIGAELCEVLTASSNLNWQLVMPSKLTSVLEKGSYDASLTIPKDFSSSLIHFFQTQESAPSLTYMVPEKTLIAFNPLISSKLKATITQASLTSLNEVLFQNFNATSFNPLQVHKLLKTLYYLDENRHMYLTLFKDYESTATQLQTTLDTIKQNFPELETSISNVEGVAESGQELLTNSTDLIDNVSTLIENSLHFISIFNTDCLSLLAETSSELNDSGSFIQALNLVEQRIFYNESLLLALTGQLDHLGRFIPLDDLTYLSHYLNNLHVKFLTLELQTKKLLQELEENDSFSIHQLNTYEAYFEPLSHSAQDALATYQTEIKPQLQKALKASLDQSTQIMTRSTNLLDELPEVGKLLETTDLDAKKTLDFFHEADAILPQLTTDFHHLVDKFKLLTENASTAEVLTALQNNPHLFADYLAAPIHIKEVNHFTMPDSGSSLASFYSVISLWLTSLLVLLLLPHPIQRLNEAENTYSLYWSELSYYLVITLLQALVLILGEHLFLGIYDLNFWAYLGTALFCTLSFTIINYSLITVLGNLGKGLSIFLLIFQTSLGHSLHSPFLQTLNLCLPFTYALNVLKKVQCNLQLKSLAFEFLSLSLFIIFFLVLSLAYFKKPLFNP